MTTEHSKLGVHLSHCNFGEHSGHCKYGDVDCPALTNSWSWFGKQLDRASAAIDACNKIQHPENYEDTKVGKLVAIIHGLADQQAHPDDWWKKAMKEALR